MNNLMNILNDYRPDYNQFLEELSYYPVGYELILTYAEYERNLSFYNRAQKDGYISDRADSYIFCRFTILKRPGEAKLVKELA